MGHATALAAGVIVPGTPTMPLIQLHLFMVLPQPLNSCTHTLYPEDPANVPNWAYTVFVFVVKGPVVKGPPLLVLNRTPDELVPVFHEYCILVPLTVLAVN